MKQFKYKLIIEAPSKEIADILIEFVAKHTAEMMKVLKYAGQSKDSEQNSGESEKEKIDKGLKAFEKAFNSPKAES